tara:strand:- start:297 stop:1538 length:1242 start_codon:yes stop_codon:yes gene_type:complete
MFTGGTFGDQTSVFLLHADNPTKSSDWTLTPNIIGELDLIPGAASSLDIEFGEDDGAHLLYQSTRSDSTGIERYGLWYAHGLIEQSSWTFKKTVGDEASLAVMKVQIINGEERITAAWREGDGHESVMIAIVADSSFEAIDNLTRTYPSRGLSSIVMQEVDRGVQVFFDVVGPTGPQVRFGIIDAEEGWLGLSNRLNLGNLYLMDRSPASSETVFIHTSASGWLIRAVVDDNDPNGDGGSLLDELRHALGLDKQNFNILLGGFAITILLLCTVILITLSARGIRWMRGRRNFQAAGTVLLEEDVVDVVDDTDIAVKTSEEDDVQLVELVEVNEGAEGRRGRRQNRGQIADVLELPPMPIPTPAPDVKIPEEAFRPPDLQLNKPIICPECDSRFEAPLDIQAAKCPVCGENIAL